MQSDFLMHYGIKGMHWGVRRFQEAGSSKRTAIGKKRYAHSGSKTKAKKGLSYTKDDNVFISGKVKYDEPISPGITKELNKMISANCKIHIGDAPGADTRVQDYLNQVGYRNVTVYTTDKKARNNVGKWKVNKINAKKYKDEREARRQKDIAMTKVCNKGFAISSDDDRPDSATSLNINRMIDKGSDVAVWDYKSKRFI